MFIPINYTYLDDVIWYISEYGYTKDIRPYTVNPNNLSNL
eukprot:UN07534